MSATPTRIHEMSASQLASAYRKGYTDPVEVTEHLLARIADTNHLTGAFVHVSRERALQDAEAARQALRDGDSRPLLGIPCPIKDLTQVAGEPFEAGTPILRGNLADITDGIVTRLAAAGTVMLGKTTTPEFGLPAYTEPRGQRPARNPWDTSTTAGGSSGGAAAALAAGYTPLAHGNDGGGSIRIPAACCGVVGLKPSRGRVSPGPYGTAGPGLVTEGVLTRTVTDAALALDAIAGAGPDDYFTAPAGDARGWAAALAAAEAAEELACHHGRVVRVGVLTEPLNVPEVEVHPESRRALSRAVEHLRAAGCEVEETNRAITAEQWDSFTPLWAVGAASVPVPAELEGELMPLTQWLRAQGVGVSGQKYAGAIAELQRLSRQIYRHWERFDVIINPTLSSPALPPQELQLPDPAADFEAQKRFTPWGSVWNMTGAPAISVPIHRTGDALGEHPTGGALVEHPGDTPLPCGIHLGAVRPGEEGLLLRLARLLEIRDPWPLLAPSYC